MYPAPPVTSTVPLEAAIPPFSRKGAKFEAEGLKLSRPAVDAFSPRLEPLVADDTASIAARTSERMCRPAIILVSRISTRRIFELLDDD